jgi:hypothetical protein
MRTHRQLKLVITIAFMIVASLILLASCKQKDYRYQITGTVDTKSGKHAAVWYTDTFNVDSSNLVITIMNSNGSSYQIHPPYTINSTD